MYLTVCCFGLPWAGLGCLEEQLEASAIAEANKAAGKDNEDNFAEDPAIVFKVINLAQVSLKNIPKRSFGRTISAAKKSQSTAL